MTDLSGVELVRPGTWKLSSGEVTFTEQMLRDAADFYAASGEMRIPLGFGHRDDRFDGDPAFGWLSNVRYAEDDAGPVLLGDLVDLDDWVAAAAPKRWPNRSVEGFQNLDFRGRTYSLVLTRLALLGSTPPGIPVLKSLSDLKQAVAASAEHVGEFIAASAPETSPESGASPAGENNPSDREGAAGMPDAAKLREALGLKADASDDEVTAALASAGLVAQQPDPPEPAPAPNPQPAPAPAPEQGSESMAQLVAAAQKGGVITIDASTVAQFQEGMIRAAALAKRIDEQDRDTLITEAVKAGKFPPARRAHYERLWDADPDGTRSIIASLAANLVPVTASGYSGDGADAIWDAEYRRLFPPTPTGGH